MDEPERMRAKYATLRPFLDERRRRLWAANEALALGRGGVTLVAAATGMARNTIRDGLRDLRARAAGRGGTAGEPRPVVVGGTQRQRRVGGGRKALTDGDPELVRALEALVEATTRGDPQSP